MTSLFEQDSVTVYFTVLQ